MGLFDIFKSEKKEYGSLHCFDIATTGLADGYSEKTKELIKLINTELKNKDENEFIKWLAKKPGYRKLEDKEIDSDSISVIYLKKYKPLDGEICKNMNQFLIPKNLIDHKDDENTVRGFRVLDALKTYNVQGTFSGKTLAILNINNYTKDWKKTLKYSKKVRRLSFQYLNLDQLEYKLLKPYEKKLNNTNFKKNEAADLWLEINNKVFTELFNTEKRKKYPINMFQAYLAFHA